MGFYGMLCVKGQQDTWNQLLLEHISRIKRKVEGEIKMLKPNFLLSLFGT